MTNMLVLLAALSLITAACTDGERTPAPDEPAAEVTQLLFSDRRALFAYDLESGAQAKITDLPSADVAVSPDGTTYATVEETARIPDPDAYRKPMLSVAPTSGESQPAELGPGRSPTWSPDGESLAAVAPATGLFICEGGGEVTENRRPGENCETAEHVLAYPVDESEPAGEARVALGETVGWTIIGWTDGDGLVGGTENGGVGVFLPDAETQALGFTVNEVWGVSPAEFTFLVFEEGKAHFATPGEGFSEDLALDPDSGLADGTWSPNGDRIVAALLVQKGIRVSSSLVSIDVNTLEITEVPDSDGALGNVVWEADGQSFAYLREDPDRGSRSQVVRCTTDLECEPLFTASRGIRLQAFR